MDGNDTRFRNAEIEDLLQFRTGRLRREISRIWRDAGLRIDLIPAERVANNWVEMPWGALMDTCNKELNRPTGHREEGAIQDQRWAAIHKETQRPSADPQVGSANLGTLLAARAADPGRAKSGKRPGKASSRAAGGGSAAGKAEETPAKARPVPRKVPAPAPPAKALPAEGPPAEAPPAEAGPWSPPPAKGSPWPASSASYVPRPPDAAKPTAPPPGHAEPARGAAEGIPAQEGPKDAARAASAPPSAPLSAMNVDQGGPKEPDVEPTAKEEADAVLSDTPPSPEAAGAGLTGTLESRDEGAEMDWSWGPTEEPSSPQEDENPEQNNNPEETPEPMEAQARLSLTASLPSHRASACLINESIN